MWASVEQVAEVALVVKVVVAELELVARPPLRRQR